MRLAGSYGSASASLRHRSQWLGLEGAPSSQNVSIHGPVGAWAAGLRINHERIGLRSQTSARASVVYPIALAHGSLRFALGGGLVYNQWHISDAVLEDPDDAFGRVGANVGHGVVDAAMSYQAEKWFAGIELLNVNSPSTAVLANSVYSIQPHLNAMAGCEMQLDQNNALRPSAALRWTANSTLSPELSLAWLWNDRLWLGGGYRLHFGALAHAQYALTKQLRIGYAYDHATGALATYQSGSHEAFLGWTLVGNSAGKSVRHFR